VNVLSEAQAQAGMDYLRVLRVQNNYWGCMYVPTIEQRLECGESLDDLIGYALHNGARWLTQAGLRSISERGPVGQSMLMLFEVTGQDRAHYGYSAANG
jgi:hypothetical protein